jgi:CBS domain-containing protein
VNVSDQMQTSPVTVDLTTTVGDIARTMTTAHSAQVIVVDADRKPLGIITAADLIAKHAKLHFPTYFSLLGFSFPVEGHREDADIRHALATTAGDLMATHLITVTSKTELDDAATLMLDNDVRCLPVVDDGILVGTIDESDIVRLLVVEESTSA